MTNLTPTIDERIEELKTHISIDPEIEAMLRFDVDLLATVERLHEAGVPLDNITFLTES